jgi:CHAD domain-containing protein
MKLSDRELELPAADGARAIVLGLLEEASEAARALAANAGEEPLHDFRVALRRLRSALRSLRPWLRQVRRKDARRLKRLARSTTGARDAEVQLAWIAGRRGALAAPRLRAGVELAVARLEARARGAPEGGRLAARYERAAGRLSGRLDRAPDGARGRPRRLDAALARLVGEQAAALRTRLHAIAGPADEALVHRARIEGKRLRYLLEPLRDGRADARAAVERLKRLQDVLGELHDAHVLAAELREALVEAATERALRLHAAAYAPGGGEATLRRALGATDARPGLLALLRLVRERRDALHAELERAGRGAGLDELEGEVQEVARALAHPEARPRRARGSPRRSSGGGRPHRTGARGRSASASSISSSSFTPTVPPKPLKGRMPSAD